MQKLLIVGLGNPSPQYSKNRHNIGFLILDALAQDLGITWSENKALKSLITSNQEVILCKPTTFMNSSGEAVRLVRDYYRIEDFFVIHDDLDLCDNELRFKWSGGNGGHNGLKSIDLHCGNQYFRARCGIGRPKEKSQVASYVLSDFLQFPQELIMQCVQALNFFVKNHNFQELQNRYTLRASQ